jgi:hypothetical protein
MKIVFFTFSGNEKSLHIRAYYRVKNSKTRERRHRSYLRYEKIDQFKAETDLLQTQTNFYNAELMHY